MWTATPRSHDLFAGFELTRSRRVLILLVGVMLLSIGDLIMTLTYLTSIGMAESNPLARLVMSYRSPWILVGWKVASMTAAGGILFIHRRRRAAEVGAWICLGVLVWLTFRWTAYIGHIQIGPASAIAAEHDPTWVTLAPDAPRPRR
jgi:uncharacterized membrane protein (Fun14 family)